MNWLFGITYKVWVISTNEDADLFMWKNWNTIMPKLNSIIELTSETPYIRTFQTYEFINKWLGFGRMKWSDENNNLWTTKYRGEDNEGKKLEFHSTEIWSPDWNSCIKNGENPELYINLYRNKNIQFSREGILLAMPREFVNKNRDLIDSKIDQISKMISRSKISQIERKWTPSKGFVNRIEHMNPHELDMLIKKGSV